MAKGSLEGDGRPTDSYRAAGVRGRDGRQHLSSPPLRLGTERRKGTLLGAAQSWSEHHATSEHDERGYGAVPGRARRDDQDRLRGLHREGEKVLVPSLRRGQVVVMDNLSLPTRANGSERSSRARVASYSLLYLPPYSPDFSPIEEAFSKVKGLLRKGGTRSREALVEAIGEALDAVTAQDARGFFTHCGYRALGQLF
jgi:transposase